MHIILCFAFISFAISVAFGRDLRCRSGVDSTCKNVFVPADFWEADDSVLAYASGISLLQRTARLTLKSNRNTTADEFQSSKLGTNAAAARKASLVLPAVPKKPSSDSPAFKPTWNASANRLGKHGVLGNLMKLLNEISPLGYSAAAITGVKRDSSGDLHALFAGLVGNGAMIVIIFLVFTFFLIRHYPDVYQHNVLRKIAPRQLGDHFYGWLVASVCVSVDEVADSICLDGAMLIEFTHLGMKAMAIIGLPLMIIMGPVDAYFGGGAAGDDVLSWPTMQNIVRGSSLYWLYVPIVWLVVIVVTELTFHTKVLFLKRRFKWLRDMHMPRASTIMVEGIPAEYRADAELKSYFVRMFGADKVKEAFVVKRLPELESAVSMKVAAERGLASSSFILSRATMQETLGALQKNVNDYERDLHEANNAIEKARVEANELAAKPGGVNTAIGFVTFTDRNIREIAAAVHYSENAREWRVRQPPAPTSVRWSDLKANPHFSVGWVIVGYVVLLLLYLAYLPCILYISIMCERINMGEFGPFWKAFAPTAGLTLMVCFLPSLLSGIAHRFFALKDECLSQHKVQVWDFWFQVTYVLLVTAIGTSVEAFVENLATDPLDIFYILAVTLPWSTHFYINYLILQMTFQVLCLWRYMNLFKYLMYSTLFPSNEAKELSEPEDQDYYGIGARSTSLVLYFNIGLVFGTLCPLVALVAFVLFASARLTFGYLIPFAETKKSDQGGYFWETQLQHIFVGLIIYCILMVGVLLQNAATSLQGAICLPTIVYVGWSLYCFRSDFNWVTVPWEELVKHAEDGELNDHQRYVQPEILLSNKKRRESVTFHGLPASFIADIEKDAEAYKAQSESSSGTEDPAEPSWRKVEKSPEDCVDKEIRGAQY